MAARHHPSPPVYGGPSTYRSVHRTRRVGRPLRCNTRGPTLLPRRHSRVGRRNRNPFAAVARTLTAVFLRSLLLLHAACCGLVPRCRCAVGEGGRGRGGFRNISALQNQSYAGHKYLPTSMCDEDDELLVRRHSSRLTAHRSGLSAPAAARAAPPILRDPPSRRAATRAEGGRRSGPEPPTSWLVRS